MSDTKKKKKKAMKIISYLNLIILSFLLIGSSCKKNDEPIEDQSGRLNFYFTHVVAEEEVYYDTIRYQNAAGNPFMVSEIQYFISDVTLHKGDGSKVLIDAWKNMHYVDSDLSDTWQWKMKDSIPPGIYDSITFTFGITEEKNHSLMFVNQPESNMFWPEYLGGGYHYLKLNGKWKDTNDVIRPYNFHMGIGQIYDQNSGEIIGFIHNDFDVSLKNSGFKVDNNETIAFTIVMDVNKWFEDPHDFDFNYWGGDIMQNQDAMFIAKENGYNVFSAHRMIEK